MKKIKAQVLVKFLITVLVVLGFLVSARVIYDNLSRSLRINPALVESYRPHLDLSLVQKAAEFLREKSGG
jgi:hypothetical protein